MQRFEIFYDTHMFAGTNWNAAAADGVQAIIFLHDDGHQEKVYGFDEYVLEDGLIVGYDIDGLPGAKRGKLIDTDKFLEIKESLESRSSIWNAK